MLASLFGKARPGTEHTARLYFGGDRTIVVPMHQDANGIYFEQPAPWMIDGAVSPAQVGKAFHRAFAAFSVVSHAAVTEKRSDWPAFKVSGCRTMKDFEARYLPVLCLSLNASNAVVRACVQHPADAELEIAWHFNPRSPADAIGQGLLRLVSAARSERDSVSKERAGT